MLFSKIPDSQFFFKSEFRWNGRKSYLHFISEFSRTLDGITETREIYVLLFFGNLDSHIIIQGYIDLNIRGEWNPAEWKVIFSAVW